MARVLLSLLLLSSLSGCSGGDQVQDCSRGFVNGPSRTDGAYFAFVARTCATDAVRICAVADAGGPIATEVIAPGIRQDCAVFSSYVGSGLGGGGECTAYADTEVGGERHRDLSRFRCVDPRTSKKPHGPERLLAPLRGSATIEGSTSDPFQRPPAAYSRRDRVRSPRWSVLVWRNRAGAICQEPGQVIRGDRIRTFAAFYTGGPPKPGEVQTALGTLRPDRKFGTGRQYFHFGRFLPYPVAEGGSCGDLTGGAGLIFGWQRSAARPDLGPARVVVSGVAGPSVGAVTVAGRPVRLSRRRAFIAVLPSGREAPVVVSYRDGRRRTFTWTRPS